MKEQNNSNDSVNCKRFWLVDYPIMSYLDDYSKPHKIRMAHLADPCAKQIGFVLDANCKFIEFVDHFSEEKDAIISYLAFEQYTEKLLLKTHTYRNPFQ